MNLANFDQHINPIILDRGYNYFLKDRADASQQGKQGIWQTKVHGTHLYNIEIAVGYKNGDEIKHCSCDCPSHALFKWLLRNYNNRPAMKDEFYKAFPQWKGKGASL